MIDALFADLILACMDMRHTKEMAVEKLLRSAIFNSWPEVVPSPI